MDLSRAGRDAEDDVLGVPQLPTMLLCAPCISDARTAELLHQPPQEIHPAATIMSGTAICDVPGRHRITVNTPGSSLLIAQPGMPLN